MGLFLVKVILGWFLDYQAVVEGLTEVAWWFWWCFGVFGISLQ